MDKSVVLSFLVQPLEDEHIRALSIIPILSGSPLPDLIASFEREHNYAPAGGYAGLVPSHYLFGPLNRYFMGESDDACLGSSEHYLLGCTCGEVGCWPLACRIMKVGDSMIWDRFKQPHRPDRDYSDFGPFRFDAQQYRTVVDEIASRFSNS